MQNDSLNDLIDVLMDKVFGGGLSREDALKTIKEHAPEVYDGLASLLNTLEPPQSAGAAHPTTETTTSPQEARLKIGPYRTLRVLGQGGMGIVYHGYRVAPFFRQAAVKLSAAPSDEKKLRFRWECQALANLQHPNIARMYEAGECEAGSYYAMEIFSGEPITDYCNRHRLGVTQRLDLFRSACEAVRHAHGRAIVHRDLKPANIMVVQEEGRASVKIIDFGIAGSLGSLSSRDLANQAGLSSSGTPGYGAPEQWRPGVGVDLRQDIYALGGILRELLLGLSPLDFQVLHDADTVNVGIWRRLDKLTRQQICSARKLSNEQMKTLFRSDLATVIQRAAATEPVDRYDSINALITDLDHWQAGRCLPWQPQSLWRRIRRPLHKNPWLPLKLAAPTLLLFLGLGAATYGYQLTREARLEQTRLKQESARILADRQFAEKHLDRLLHASTAYSQNRLEGYPAVLLQVAKDLAKEPIHNQANVAELRLELGRAFYNLGMFGHAVTQYLGAYTSYKELHGPNHPLTIKAMNQYAVGLINQGRLDKAEGLLKDLWAIHEQFSSPGQPERVKTLLYTALLKLGRNDYQAAYEISILPAGLEAGAAPAQKDLWAAKLIMVKALIGLGRTKEARSAAETAWRYHVQRYGKQHPDSCVSMYLLARVYFEDGRLREASALLKPLLEIRSKRLGPEHVDTLETKELFALVLYRQGSHGQALKMMEDAMALRQATRPKSDLFALWGQNNFLTLLIEDGRLQQAEMVAQEISEGYLLGGYSDHPNYLSAQQNIGELHRLKGNHDKALSVLKKVETDKINHSGPNHYSTLITQCTIGQVHLDRGQLKQAQTILSDVVARSDQNPNQTWYCANFRIYLGEALIRRGIDLEKAAEHLRKARLVLSGNARAMGKIDALQMQLESVRVSQNH